MTDKEKAETVAELRSLHRIFFTNKTSSAMTRAADALEAQLSKPQDELPELPEPEHWYYCCGEAKPTDGFTADQMREYGQLCRASRPTDAQPAHFSIAHLKQEIVDLVSSVTGDYEPTEWDIKMLDTGLDDLLSDIQERSTDAQPQTQPAPALSDELKTALNVFDIGIGMAPCHRDFGATRNAIKKLQEDFTALRAILQAAQPVADIPEGAAIDGKGGTYYRVAETYQQAEELECLHLCLDKAGVPRADENDAVLSAWGRVKRYKAAQPQGEQK